MSRAGRDAKHGRKKPCMVCSKAVRRLGKHWNQMHGKQTITEMLAQQREARSV